MKVEVDNEVKEFTPEEYVAYHKAKAWQKIAGHVSWMSFWFCVTCCVYCNHIK